MTTATRTLYTIGPEIEFSALTTAKLGPSSRHVSCCRCGDPVAIIDVPLTQLEAGGEFTARGIRRLADRKSLYTGVAIEDDLRAHRCKGGGQ